MGTLPGDNKGEGSILDMFHQTWPSALADRRRRYAKYLSRPLADRRALSCSTKEIAFHEAVRRQLYDREYVLVEGKWLLKESGNDRSH